MSTLELPEKTIDAIDMKDPICIPGDYFRDVHIGPKDNWRFIVFSVPCEDQCTECSIPFDYNEFKRHLM